MHKRTFMKNMLLISAGLPTFLRDLGRWVNEIESLAPEQAAQDEEFWMRVRSGYRLKPDYINLENGYYNFIPQEILENYIHHIREINYQGSYYMRTVQWDNKQAVAARLAQLTDCKPTELVITRNTTESMDTIIGGYPWQAGDEALMAEQDYFSMLEMFEQQAVQHGIVNRRISLPLHPRSDDEIVNLYANAIGPRTRLLMVCHMVNITGQVLPIRKICDMAHSKGVEVMVDGAHAVAHLCFSIKNLNCDYYGASLHKWLSAPLGAGLLYVREEKIPQIRPMMAGAIKDAGDIRRLNHTGTLQAATDLAIGNAIDYYLLLGPERKEARLRFLQNYWTSRVRELPGVLLNTPAAAERACGIANVGIAGMKPAELADVLMKKYRIWAVAIDDAGVQGCRITPNVYTSLPELDALVNAITALSKS